MEQLLCAILAEYFSEELSLLNKLSDASMTMIVLLKSWQETTASMYMSSYGWWYVIIRMECMYWNVSFIYRSCRYDKCISVGMLPCLVNSVNRKPYTKVVSSDKRALAIVPSKTPSLPVQIILSTSQIENQKLLSIDFFEKEYVQCRMVQVLEDIWDSGLEQVTFEHSKKN